jgi:hypothetical protein
MTGAALEARLVDRGIEPSKVFETAACSRSARVCVETSRTRRTLANAKRFGRQRQLVCATQSSAHVRSRGGTLGSPSFDLPST